ncbi:ribosome small subunit-dependent GTPase A [Patescibacteria group bacterium]|nr:ribosome small subunit-dependent GTPase A [Patescibacteria group bacterium]
MLTHLQKYGWNDFFQDAYQKFHSETSTVIPGRVTGVHRTNYNVAIENDEIVCEITGNRLKDNNPYTKPVVGDWVLVELGERYNANIIREILPRNTILERRKVNSDDEVQIIASNVDRAVIVQSLAQDFSVRRLERNLVQLADAGIEPTIVLNKLDLVDEITSFQKQMEAINPNIPVVYSSFITEHGLADLQGLLNLGETVVFIGSSGVGKSSIINTMLDIEEQQKTGEVSTYSGKGKHTTTARKLFLLDNGVIVIDTPGTREFGLTVDDQDVLREQFADIEDIARGCKFNDCQHDTEPQCAVKEAIDAGRLDQSMVDTYRRLSSEIQS